MVAQLAFVGTSDRQLNSYWRETLCLREYVRLIGSVPEALEHCLPRKELNCLYFTIKLHQLHSAHQKSCGWASNVLWEVHCEETISLTSNILEASSCASSPLADDVAMIKQDPAALQWVLQPNKPKSIQFRLGANILPLYLIKPRAKHFL